MKNEVNHIEDRHVEFFKKVELPFEKDKDAIWDLLDEKIQDNSLELNKGKLISFTWFRLAAAMVALLVSTTFFMRLYTEKVDCLNGQRISYALPDGSVIDMNSASALSYHPLWWRFKREVNFEGEAFFKVEKGQKFSIISAQGTTEILGTSFNVFAREMEYKVFCKTGKVRVKGILNGIGLVIEPGEMAVFNEQLSNGEVLSPNAGHVLAWQNDTFNFESLSLVKVIQELERHYDLRITLNVKNPQRLIYTGHFKRGKTVDASLNYVCKSFNLNYRKVSKGHYKVTDKK